MRETKKNLGGKLAAYSLAAGVAGLAGSATPADAAIMHFDNGGAGWFSARPHFGGQSGGFDMILFKLDGTVLVGDAAIDPTLPNAPSIEFMGESYNGQYAWGDGKTRDSAFARLSNAGVVGNYWSSAAEANRLAVDVPVNGSSSFVTGDAEGDVGLYGYGWYSVVGQFAGRGYLGMYIEDGVGERHYGWADMTIISSRNEITLHSFAFQDTAEVSILTGEVPEPVTFSLLSLGAAGLLARRKRA